MEPWIAGRNPVRLKDADGSWESRCTVIRDPDGLGHSLPHVAAAHYCKKHMLESIFTTVLSTFCPTCQPAPGQQPASPHQPATCGQLTTFSNTLLLFSRCLDPKPTGPHHLLRAPPFQRPRGSTWMQANTNNETHCLAPDT